MTPYERGYAAGLKAAAEVCRRGEQEQLDNLKIEPSNLTMNGIRIGHARDAEEILSLPIQCEATNHGEQVPDSARIGSESHVTTPARPGPLQECVSDLSERLRQYADIADAGGKAHWANAMREAMYTLAVYRQNAAKEEHDAPR